MNEQLQKADILFEQQRWQGALDSYLEVLAESPDDAHTMCQIARCFLKLELYGEASSYASDAVGADPDFSYAYYIQAYVFYLRNLHEDARRAIEYALLLEPLSSDYHTLLGRLRAHSKDWTGALEAANSALEQDVAHIDARLLKSSVLVWLGQFDEATVILNSILEKEPENEYALNELGDLHLHRSEWEQAADSFQRSLAINPESEEARTGLLSALRARYPLYGLILRYFLWLQKYSRRYQQMIVYGMTFLTRYLERLRKTHPGLAPLLGLVLLVWRIFTYLTWTIQSATTLLLRWNKFGRSLVSEREIWESNLVGGLWLAAGGCALYHHFVDPFTLFCRIGIPVFLTLPLVVGGAFASPKAGWPKYVSYGILGVMGVSALVGLFLYTWAVPLGKSLLLFYFSSFQIALFVLAMLEGVETAKN